MQKTKRSHWVSQSYLRSFAADPESREKIWRFSKNEGAPELKAIQKVAVRFYLYAPKDETGKPDYSFETKLAELENWFGYAIWSELCNGMVDLTSEPIRRMVALLVAVMHARNPAKFEEWRVMHSNVVAQISAMPEVPHEFEHKGKVYKLDTSTWPAYRDASEEDLKRAWLKDVGGAAWIASHLMKMRWAVVFADEPVFITSDNPVTILHPSLRFRGITNPETRVLFPLSPTRYLSMDNTSEPDGHYYPLNNAPANFNHLIWRGAIEHMFSHRDPDIVCAEMLDEAEAMRYA